MLPYCSPLQSVENTQRPGDHRMSAQTKSLDGAGIKTHIQDHAAFSENYDVHSELGRGKFAVVKKCQRKCSAQPFAAKFLRKRRKGADARKEILQEVAMLELDHPHLVRLHEVFETSHDIVLVTEYAAGGELFHHIMMEDGFQERECIRLLQQILTGLLYLHERDIVHLDVKPQNILLTEKPPLGNIKLCDFGFARKIQSQDDVRDIIGTPDYVAPEVLNYEPLHTSCDMWSVGVLAYVMLTGCSPFAGDNKMETFSNITQLSYDFPDELFENISNHAIDFIRRLLKKEPDERMTAEQSLKHPWLYEERQKLAHPVSPFGSPLGCRRTLTPEDAHEPPKKCRCEDGAEQALTSITEETGVAEPDKGSSANQQECNMEADSTAADQSKAGADEEKSAVPSGSSQTEYIGQTGVEEMAYKSSDSIETINSGLQNDTNQNNDENVCENNTTFHSSISTDEKEVPHSSPVQSVITVTVSPSAKEIVQIYSAIDSYDACNSSADDLDYDSSLNPHNGMSRANNHHFLTSPSSDDELLSSTEMLDQCHSSTELLACSPSGFDNSPIGLVNSVSSPCSLYKETEKENYSINNHSCSNIICDNIDFLLNKDQACDNETKQYQNNMDTLSNIKSSVSSEIVDNCAVATSFVVCDNVVLNSSDSVIPTLSPSVHTDASISTQYLSCHSSDLSNNTKQAYSEAGNKLNNGSDFSHPVNNKQIGHVTSQGSVYLSGSASGLDSVNGNSVENCLHNQNTFLVIGDNCNGERSEGNETEC